MNYLDLLKVVQLLYMQLSFYCSGTSNFRLYGENCCLQELLYTLLRKTLTSQQEHYNIAPGALVKDLPATVCIHIIYIMCVCVCV